MICNLKFKKDVLILKMLFCFEFYAFGFEAIPHPSCYLTSILDKAYNGPVAIIVAPFSVPFVQLF